MTRKLVSGQGVSPGIAIGEPVIHRTRPITAMRVQLKKEEVDGEIARFHAAVKAAIEQIKRNEAMARDKMGAEYAAIFEAHKLIAADPSLTSKVESIIREQQVNAEWAYEQVVGEFLEELEGMGDAYLSERRLDLLDVANLVLSALRGSDLAAIAELERPVVLVADDLPPSQVVQLPLQHVLGFVLETGGPTSHTTIIARSLGIPAVVGAHGACEAAESASVVVVDAFAGEVAFNPDRAELEEYRSRRDEYEKRRRHLEELVELPATTRDGHKVTLLANIDLPQELESAIAWGAEGVGLYRSEFLYMARAPALPSEEDHVQFYRKLAVMLGERPLTIRTFDLGGKKLAREVVGSQEANPVLGLRGIRLCLRQRDFFEVQLRAILKVAGERPPGQVRLMLPLISGLEEVRATKLLISQILDQLKAEGHPTPSNVPLGIMVEVPSTAVMADLVAPEVDFFSIGTNDLIQYTLAVDRANELVADMYRSSHPAILRLIEKVIRVAKEAGIEVSMCGETASDPLMVPVLIGLGLKKFSVNPHALPVVRNVVRHLSYREAVSIARTALTFKTAGEVEEYLLERLAILYAKIKIHL